MFLIKLMWNMMLWICATVWCIGVWLIKTVFKAIGILIGFIISLLFPSAFKDTDTITPNTKKEMSGLDYEMYCGKYLLTHGFHDVRTTPPSGDYGADLVAKDANGVTWVFQCKHYKSKVGNSCVQEVVAAKKHYGAEKAAVMTNSELTEKARELAIENEVLLFELLSD